MKRLSVISVSIALCLALCLSLSACGNSVSSDDPALGVWVCTKASAYGFEMDIVDVFGEAPSLEVKANGSVVLDFEGDKSSGKWSREDNTFTITSGNEEIVATLSGNTMKFDDFMGISLNFVKEGAEETNGGSAELNENFVGLWVCKTVAMLGEPHSDTLLEVIKVSDYIFVELAADGTGRFYYMNEEVETNWTSSSENSGTVEFMSIDCIATIDNGELTFGVESGDGNSLEFIFEAASGTFDEKVANIPENPFSDMLGELEDGEE